MIQTLFILPFLIAQVNLQQNYIYTNHKFGLTLTVPLLLTQTADEYYWELEDENMDFWFDCERVPLEEFDLDIEKTNVKKVVKKMAEEMGYEDTKDGGPIPNVPEGHFVIDDDEGYITYIMLIIDRRNKVVYEIFLDDALNNKPAAFQLINSLRFVN